MLVPPPSAVSSYRLRFRIPQVGPGTYAFVIYNDGGHPGSSGTLVVDTSSQGRFLRVRSEQDSVASQGSGSDPLWFVAAAAAVAAAAGAAVFLRRR